MTIGQALVLAAILWVVALAGVVRLLTTPLDQMTRRTRLASSPESKEKLPDDRE